MTEEDTPIDSPQPPAEPSPVSPASTSPVAPQQADPNHAPASEPLPPPIEIRRDGAGLGNLKKIFPSQ